jgi:hypothetical protein
MVRRVISVLAILALALTIAPGGLDSTSLALDCCNGIMCPMHAVQAHAPSCDMDEKGSALRPCPVQTAAHYTGAIVFVLLAPTTSHGDARSEAVIAFLPNFSSDAEIRVDSPPPRLPPTA